jgi:outer membrane protein assembly factor BamA
VAEYDSTDNFFYPRNGLSVTGEYQFYTNFLGGDYRYNTLTLDGKYFQPLSRDFTLVLGENPQDLSDHPLLPTIGAGYRFEVKPDMNLRLDLGLGKESVGFYFQVAEAF